jgi:hypothetical protein
MILPTLALVSIVSESAHPVFSTLQANVKLRDDYAHRHGLQHLQMDYAVQLGRFRLAYPTCTRASQLDGNFNKLAGLYLLLSANRTAAVDWFWYLDADAFLTNWDIDPLHWVRQAGSNTHFIAGCHPHASDHYAKALRTCTSYYTSFEKQYTMNAGVMFIRNSLESRRVLWHTLCQTHWNPKAVVAAGYNTPLPLNRDQPALAVVLESRPVCPVWLLNQRHFNSHFTARDSGGLCGHCCRHKSDDLVAHAYAHKTDNDYPYLAHLLLKISQTKGSQAIPSRPTAPPVIDCPVPVLYYHCLDPRLDSLRLN